MPTTVDARRPSLADDFETYVRLGEHRAGTPQEAATAHWFMTRLDAMD